MSCKCGLGSVYIPRIVIQMHTSFSRDSSDEFNSNHSARYLNLIYVLPFIMYSFVIQNVRT